MSHDTDAADIERLKLELTAARDALAISAHALDTSKREITKRNDFLAMVAHDLRSPLNVVTISAGVLLKVVNSLDGGRPARKLVQRIQHSSDLMSHFITDLLDVTTAESGNLSLRLGPQNVNALIDEAQDTLSVLAGEKGLTMTTAIRTKPTSRVICDRPRFLQLVSNLVGNAIKFTDRGGSITIGADDQEKHVLFWVKDTGRGIGQDDLPQVFEQYWKGRTLRDDGYGLGLAIVRNLVEAQGGVVSATSVLTEGSTFAFTLPRAPDGRDSSS